MIRTSDLEAGSTSSSKRSKPDPPKTNVTDIESSDSENDSDDLAPDSSLESDYEGGSDPPDPDPSVRRCPCFPDGETEAQCKERIARITEKQKKCYGITFNISAE